MSTKKAMTFDVNEAQKKIHVEREFSAPLSMVWQAWTDAEILDMWWAPKPWKCETRRMDFRPGGRWHYAMVGPEGERQWCLADYKMVNPEKRYTLSDAFCDENEIADDTKPAAHWDVNFVTAGDETRVVIDVLFDNSQDVADIIKMGFREGFTMGLENLDEYLATKHRK